MRNKEECSILADILFPDVVQTPEDMFNKYPKRNLNDDSMVLRFAPSPTGFLHIGTVYTGMICTILAKQSSGVSILRIEDTDKGREIENGISTIVNGLKDFGVYFDEGPIDTKEYHGVYGPYIQSQRLDIYKVFAKQMVKDGNAYPCFLSEEELEEMRVRQEEAGERTGCYGKWAVWREKGLEEVKERLDKGEKFVIRIYSTGNAENIFHTADLIKGNLTLHENDMDMVLLKSDGYPTYHFAHPIDDTLMGITHILRGDEWLPSQPLHRELFEKLGFKTLPYGHLSPLMKSDNGNRRKLSKRKDPEADVLYYIERGYPKDGIKEYLLNIANSNFYDWRIQNPNIKADEFVLKIEKMNKAGALFDIVKLNDTCKEYISRLNAQTVYDMSLDWAKNYNDGIAKLLEDNKEYCINILNIEREGEKIRKDMVKFEDVKNQLEIFFDELIPDYENISNRIDMDKQKMIVQKYLEVFNISENWFEDVRQLASTLGLSAGDVAMVLRVAITHRTKSPDLYQVIKVLGEEKVRERLEKYIS
ncbi:MAG: glutamate--tRNA ligase [Candidatus Dojkabacteria bacterium]|nr:glutamate--tRNA ligase [Candidatus Dojkabacteria bacterium]